MLILYLEDNPLDADLAVRCLRRSGAAITVEVAATLQQAISSLEQHTAYDLVLTDLWLPDGTGLDLLAYIRHRDLPLPVMVLTGAGDDEAAVGAIKAGAMDYIVKEGDYLDRLPTLFQEALTHYQEQLATQARSIQVLYSGYATADVDLLQHHLLTHAPHIRLNVVAGTKQQVLPLLKVDRQTGSPSSDTHYDVILLDYQTLEDSALAMMGALQQRQLDLPVVVMTEQGDENVAVQVLKQGADYLVKHRGYLYQLPGMLENAFHRGLLLRNQATLRDNLEKLKQLFNQPLTGMAFIATDHRWLEVNDRLCTLLGYSRQELTSSGWLQLTYAEDLADELAQCQRLLDGAIDGYETDKRFLRRDGTVVWTSVSVRAVRKADHTVDYLVGLFNDITARKEAESQLQLAAQVFEFSGDGIFVSDAHNRILSVNQALTSITGYTADELLGNPPYLFSYDTHNESLYQQVFDELNHRGYWQGELLSRRKNGEKIVIWLTTSVIRNSKGEITNYIGIFSDITLNKQAQEQIQFLAHYDALTKLPNRALLQDRVNQFIAAATRNNSQFALLFLDLDRFKNVNDSLGHLVGDQLLQAVAERLKDCVRKVDTLSRLGGDEFILVLPDTDLQGAVNVAQKCLDSLVKPFLVGEHEIIITTSIGISIFPEDGQDFVVLVRNADAAMYHAKEKGRNNFQFFAPEMNTRVLERMKLEGSLRRALERDEFVLYYQPQVDTVTGAIIGMEALIRWQHPERGFLAPNHFIPVAEETGLIIGIGGWVLNEVCRQNAAWCAQGLPAVPIAVNISAVHFCHKDFADQVESILLKHQLPPRLLELEVTESVLMEDSEFIISGLDRLKNIGVQLSIDDFGTGYSSLAYLKRLPIHKLKIDRSFVRNILTEPDDATIIRTIISMTKSLNLRVIAEGVETFEQLTFLAQQGCDECQGYYFSQPIPAEKIGPLLGSQRLSA